LVGHISRENTAIEAREKPVVKPDQPVPMVEPKRSRGRPPQGRSSATPPLSRIHRQSNRDQRGISPAGMLAGLPRNCDVGAKHNATRIPSAWLTPTEREAKRHQETWVGCKLHIDITDGGIPVSCVLTAASVQDSQAAVPLAAITAARVTKLYDLRDCAYDAEAINNTAAISVVRRSSASIRAPRPGSSRHSQMKQNGNAMLGTVSRNRFVSVNPARPNGSMASCRTTIVATPCRCGAAKK